MTRLKRVFWVCLGLGISNLLLQAEEKASPWVADLSSTTINGYVDTSMHWDLGPPTPVPEPSSAVLLLVGGVMLASSLTLRSRGRTHRQ